MVTNIYLLEYISLANNFSLVKYGRICHLYNQEEEATYITFYFLVELQEKINSNIISNFNIRINA